MNTFFSIINRIGNKQMEFPLKNISSIAVRPSISRGEILYSLPIVKSLSKKYDLSILLPEEDYFDYFKGYSVNIIEYPLNMNLVNVYRMRRTLRNYFFDLFIELNENNIDKFIYILRNPVTASIFGISSANLIVKSKSDIITDRYQYLMELLGFSVDWGSNAIDMKKWKAKGKKIGITSEIGEYPGFEIVNSTDDLYRISSFITIKNDLSVIAYLLGIPQILLLRESDEFHPPSSIEIIRYTNKIDTEIINKCLKSQKK